MKLTVPTDFTSSPRATSVLPAAGCSGDVAGKALLAHDERELRRRAVMLADGSQILIDLSRPATLHDGDRLVLEDGRQFEIAPAPEDLYEVHCHNATHLAELAWHLGSRHIAAAFEAGRILVPRTPANRTTLEELGATVAEIVAAFSPLHDSSGHDHHHEHHGHGHHGHGHGHGEPDAYGRLPGDPHYGHNHP